ncbi:MAG: catecholate siderophore receptor [Candidatus Poribacteria bacterium]|nr:catecholate siderophore receptor [Candidatus Poribacteria bacterium]
MRLSEKMSYWYINSRITDIHKIRLDEEASNRDWTTISAYFDTTTTLNTGPIKHALLLRVDFLRDAEDGWYARSLSDDAKTRPFIDLTNLNIVGIPGSDAFLKSTKDNVQLETNRDCLGVALQDEMRIGQALRISLGTRVDRHTYVPYNSKDWMDPRIMASPHAGITWNVFDKLALYTAYSNTRTPNWGNVDINGKEMTNNRYSNSYEVGVKSQLTGRLLASCALFRNDQKNLPVSYTSGTVRYAVLEGRFLAQGVEASVEGYVNKNLSCTFSYTGQKFEDAKGEEPRAKNLPKNSFAFYPTYIHTGSGFLNGIRVGLGVRYMDERYILGPGTTTAEDIMPSYTVLDAFVVYPLAEQASLRLNVNNVTNEEYFTSDRTFSQVERGDPFNVQLTCVYRF